MFTNRHEKSGRRPSADFVARFKEHHFSPKNRPMESQHHLKKGSKESDQPDVGNLGHAMDDMDPTPKATDGLFRFTPSLLDPNSSAFAAFAAQPPGYYTPTPGGSLSFQPNEMAVNIQTFNTPNSLTDPNQNIMSPPSIFQAHFTSLDHQSHHMHFRHHPYAENGIQGTISGSAIECAETESSSNYSPETASGVETTNPEVYPTIQVRTKLMSTGIARNQDIHRRHVPRNLICSLTCKFRFATILHAATAMLRHSSDIPVTYLNKGQVYTVSIIDNSPAVQNKDLKRYRTTVRIAFDEEDQRRTAPACWRLWKDGRGTLESGGNLDKLRSIDYEPVETRAVKNNKWDTETNLQVENASTSFDRFTVTWSSRSLTPAVHFCVRFRFLSTDFSQSKGVKGVPVRLVAKTAYLGSGESTFQNTIAAELAYCKIKLFREKGAQRKLANDRQHLQQAIEKLRQKAQQLTIGTSETKKVANKRLKRDSFGGACAPEPRSTSPQRRPHRDLWISSDGSTSSANGTPRSHQDETQQILDKAVSMEETFSSVRPVSVLSLIGDPSDDPGLLFPSTAQSQWEAPGMGVLYPVDGDKLNVNTAKQISPALSRASFSSVTSDKLSYRSSPLVHPDASVKMAGMMAPSQLTQKVHIQAAMKDIDAMDVDPFYVSMPVPSIRPALCVYVAPAKISPNGDPHTMHLPTAIDPLNDTYYAVYVPSRSANALTMAIATKMKMDTISILRTTIVNRCGLRLALDDEVARDMLEKQDMRVAVQEIETISANPKDTATDKGSGLELFLAF